MNIALTFKKEFITAHPELKEDVEELYDLYEMEVKDGGSPQNEYHLFVNSCEELLLEEEEDLE